MTTTGTTCPDCAAARAALVARAEDDTLHATCRGWVRATYRDGRWTPLPGETATSAGRPYVSLGDSRGDCGHRRGVDELATMGVYTYATGEEAMGADRVLCERHEAGRSEEYRDLAGGLRSDARTLEAVRVRKTRPLADLVAEFDVGRGRSPIAAVSREQGLDLAALSPESVTDAVVWAAFRRGHRAPGGAERWERGLPF